MKVKTKNLTEEECIKTLDALYTAAGTMRGRDAMKLFLRDLLTESERVMLGRRILIARKLLSGASYREVIASLGVGMDTVQKVQHWLEDQMPGYEKAIAGLEKEVEKRRKKYEKPALGTFPYLKKKYPLHFLLFNLADDIATHLRYRKQKH
jgi:uncharacterized protein YerC